MMKLMIAVAATLTLGASPALAQTKPVLGPNGLGGVKLGMSLKQARATGTLTKKIDGGGAGCSGWDLKKYPTGKDNVGLYISPKLGVAAIFAPKTAKTPEGVAIGTAASQLKKLYPRLKQDTHGFWVTTVPGNKQAYYSFTVLHGKVKEFGMALNKQDCFN
ncbi:hypothetical protein ACIBO5_39230 [Nonomuraea angiospora]|uniref:hypothetical protein n=1 Tax=Nonomuraea angiospora TaxID=46172 RepID=UPI0037A66EF0